MNNVVLSIDQLSEIEGGGWLDLANGFCAGLTLGGGLAYFGVITVTLGPVGTAASGLAALGCVGVAVYDFYE